MKKYQFVYWGFRDWHGFHFIKDLGSLSFIYKWILVLGIFELRKQLDPQERYNKELDIYDLDNPEHVRILSALNKELIPKDGKLG